MIEAMAKARPEAARMRLPEAPLQRSDLQAQVPVSPSQLDCRDDMPQVLTVGKSVMEMKCCRDTGFFQTIDMS